MITYKRTEQPTRTNAYIGLIEDSSDAAIEELTLTKRYTRHFDTCYEVAIRGEVIGFVMGKTGSNYRPYGNMLQVQLRDSVKWSVQLLGASTPRKTSARTRIEAIASLVREFYTNQEG